MRKFFEALGLISLICFSFYATNQTALVIKETDEIMKTIKNQKEIEETNIIEPIVTEDSIIPGLSGKEIDVTKSYQSMKRYGYYDQKMLIYKSILPNQLLNKNHDKYIISGNNKKKMVSLVFVIKKDNNINKLVSILEEKNIKATFFLDSNFVESDNNSLLQLSKKGHLIGNGSNNYDYTSPDFLWLNTIIKKIAKQKNGYCYTENKNEQTLNSCSLNKNHTIIPSIIAKGKYYDEIKTKLTNGSIISLDITSSLETELPIIINYIESKGLNIVTLDDLLNENIVY